MTYSEQHVQELVKTINTLRAERDEARRTVTERRRERDEARGERDEARRQRDSARRMYCCEMAHDGNSPADVAEALGWDITRKDET